MKIRKSVDFFKVLDEYTKPSGKRSWGKDNAYHPINLILELEDTDFEKAIELCRKYEAPSVEEMYKAFHLEWKERKLQSYPTTFLKSFIQYLFYEVRGKHKREEVTLEVDEIFKDYNLLLENFNEAYSFYMDFHHVQKEYSYWEKKWEKIDAVMESFKSFEAKDFSKGIRLKEGWGGARFEWELKDA